MDLTLGGGRILKSIFPSLRARCKGSFRLLLDNFHREGLLHLLLLLHGFRRLQSENDEGLVELVESV